MSWQLNGLDVVSGALEHPAAGNWSATLQIIADTAPTVGTACTFSLEGLTLSGTVLASGIFAERVTVRLCGGAGKLGSNIPGQGFVGGTGLIVAQSITSAAGEQLDPASDAPGLSHVLQHYAYFGGPAGKRLEELCATLGCSWWMTPTGQVHLGILAYPAADPAGSLLLDQRGDLLVMNVALEDEALVPRTTYQGQQVLAVEHVLTPQSWRAQVRYAGPVAEGLDAFDAQLGVLVRHHQVRTIPPLDAEVLSQDPTTGALELRLLMSEAEAAQLRELYGIDTGLQDVPFALQGCFAVQVAPQARVVLEFLNSDPAKPVVRTVLSGTFMSLTVDATTITIGPTLAAAVNLGKALKTVASFGDVTTNCVVGSPVSIAPTVNQVVKV